MALDRKAALTDLITLSRPMSVVLGELRKHGWDSSEPLVALSMSHVSAILARFLNGELPAETVEDWANAIEGRDDVDYSSSHSVALAIHELANPLLTQPLTRQSAMVLVASFSA